MKGKNQFKTYFRRIFQYVYILFISYTIVALFYTTVQIASGEFRLDAFGFRVRVEQTFISPVKE